MFFFPFRRIDNRMTEVKHRARAKFKSFICIVAIITREYKGTRRSYQGEADLSSGEINRSRKRYTRSLKGTYKSDKLVKAGEFSEQSLKIYLLFFFNDFLKAL